MTGALHTDKGQYGHQIGAKFWQETPEDILQEGQDQASAGDYMQLDPTQQSQQAPATAGADQGDASTSDEQQGPTTTTAASAAAEEFRAGTQARVWELVDLQFGPMRTNTVLEFTIQEPIRQHDSKDSYVVRLDNLYKSNFEPQPAGSSEIWAALQHSIRSKPLPNLQAGRLYVLKVCRPLQALSALSAEEGRAAVRDVHTQLLQEQDCYGSVEECQHFVRCLVYGRAEVAVPGAAAAPFRAERERPCLLLEYAPGGSVGELLRPAEDGVAAAGMSEQHAREVMLSAAQALLHCHRKRIIYRDVQPSNIVMMQPPEGETGFENIDFKMVDFASSFRMDEELGSGHCFGLPAYLAPEMRLDYYHHYTLDTWQLGCLLMHLRTGELPLPELAGLPEQEWLAQVSAVHTDIMHCEQHPYLQRYACLSQKERQLISQCLIPDANARPMAVRVFEDCEYFDPED